MKTARFIKAKVIAPIIAIIGVIVSVIFWIIQTRNWQDYWMRAMTYSYVNPISGKKEYHSGSEIGELSLFQFAFSDDMNSAIWIETVIVLAVFVVAAILFYAFYCNEELVIRENGIEGKAVKGKPVDLSFDRISTVKKCALKGLVIKTAGQENVKFRLLKNQAEIIEEICKRISTKASVSQASVTGGESTADQIKKYKELLDSGVITQEEFEIKKKQLLGV